MKTYINWCLMEKGAVRDSLYPSDTN